ncbi:hypothetical protein BJS_00477 [Bradyrhizobium japonicum SEMIA 5079]|nr:hypothetical protein BJS_00477 [Bradyrhizobium japonicum SEMIA 5079]
MVGRTRSTALVHPRNYRCKVTASDNFSIAANIQTTDEANNPGFESAFYYRVLGSVRPSRARLRAGTHDGGAGAERIGWQ